MEETLSLDDVNLDSLKVISTKESGNQYKVRYFSTAAESENKVEPTLEDAYLYVIQEKDNG